MWEPRLMHRFTLSRGLISHRYAITTKALAKLERKKAHPVPRYLSNVTGFCVRGTLNDDAWHRITTYSRDLNVLFT